MCKLLFPPPVTVLGVLTPALYLPDTELCIFLLPVLPETKHESLPLTTQEKESREEVGRGKCREERMDAPDYLSICPTLSLCAAQRLYLSFYCSVGKSACRGVKHGSVPPLHFSFNTCKLSLCPHQSPLLEATNSGETSKMLFPCCFQSRYMDICHFSSLPKESSSQPPSHKFTELEKMHLSFVHV